MSSADSIGENRMGESSHLKRFFKSSLNEWPICIRFNPVHLNLGLPNGLKSSGEPHSILCIRELFCSHAWSAQKNCLFLMSLSMFDLWYSYLISALCPIPHSPVFTSTQGPKINLRIFFSSTKRLFCCILCSIQVALPYITTGRIRVVYSCNFRLLDSIFDLNNLFNPK